MPPDDRDADSPEPSTPPQDDELVALLERGARPRSEWRIGLEIEKMGLDARTSRPLAYDGPDPSIRSVLEAIAAERPSRRVLDGEHLIGLVGDWGSVSIEPGGQVEWASPKARTLSEMRKALRGHLDGLARIATRQGIRWLEVALQPETRLEDMPWMPKTRYRIMREHFRGLGRHAHRMMTQTASVQVSVDYSDEPDWREKFRAGFLLAPLAVAAFANSRTREGADTGYASFRSHIWAHTDPARCGAPGFVFDKERFGFADWVEFLLDLPLMFRRDGGGLVPAPGLTFRRFRAEGAGGRKPTVEDWNLHLTEVFTEVRTKTYVEIRSADLPSDRSLPAVPAFWVGLLYHEGAAQEALDRIGWGRPGRRPPHDEWSSAMEDAARLGTKSTLGGRPVSELLAEVVAVARDGLEQTEPGSGALLDPIAV